MSLALNNQRNFGIFFREMGGAFGSGFLLSKSNDDIILLAMNSSQPA